MAAISRALVLLLVVVACAGAASAFECAENYCATVLCAAVDGEACANSGGYVNFNGGFCGCCPTCIRIVPVGHPCPLHLMGVPPTAECVYGSACINNVCTSLESITTEAA